MSRAEDAAQEAEIAALERIQREILARARYAEAMQAPVDLACIDCDEAIPPERLHAVPSTVRCVFCQATHDRQHARRL